MDLTLPLVVALVLIGPIAVAAIVWRRPLVLCLPFLVTLNGLSIPLGSASIRIDQLVACFLVLPFAAAVLTRRRRLVVDATTWLLVAILALNVVASAVFSPVPAYSLLQCVNLATAWGIYVLVLNFVDSPETLDRFFRNVLWAGAVACAIGVAAYLLAIGGLNVGGAEVSALAAEHLTEAYGAYGTMLEPNLLGSFAAAQLVIALGVLAAARTPTLERYRRLAAWLAGLSAGALVLSFTRAAWLGALVGLATVSLAGGAVGLRVRSRPIVLPIAVALTVGTALLLTPGSAGELFRYKLANVVNLSSQTVSLRLITYAMAFQQVLVHPILGWGTFTFAPLVAGGADFQHFENWRNLWVGNFLLLALHDTGVVGLGLWIALPWLTVVRGVRTARGQAATDPGSARITLALVGAVVALLIPFMTTSGFSLGYPWVIIGLLGAHARLARTATAPGVTEA